MSSQYNFPCPCPNSLWSNQTLACPCCWWEFYFSSGFTCTTDEHGGAEGDTCTATGMNPHRQGFNESPLLKCDIIRQPGPRHSKRWMRTQESLISQLWHKTLQSLKNQSLVTEVGVVRVISAQVSIIWRRGTEEDGGRQIIAPFFEKLIHLTGHTRLNGHSVTWEGKGQKMLNYFKIMFKNANWVFAKLGGRAFVALSVWESCTHLCSGVWQLIRPSPHVLQPRGPAPLVFWVQSLQFDRSASSAHLIHRFLQNASGAKPLRTTYGLNDVTVT